MVPPLGSGINWKDCSLNGPLKLPITVPFYSKDFKSCVSNSLELNVVITVSKYINY